MITTLIKRRPWLFFRLLSGDIPAGPRAVADAVAG